VIAATGALRPGETLAPRLVGRLAGALWVCCGLLVVVTLPIVHYPASADRPAVAAVGAVAIGVGMLVWVLPWGRWPRSATLVVVVPAFVAIALYSLFSHDEGAQASLFYLVSFVWLGLGHRQFTSLAIAPLAAVAFLVPVMVDGTGARVAGLPSIAYVLPCCVLLGETVSWVSTRLRRSESALTVAEARFRSAFEQAPVGMGMASLDGRLLQANRAFADILGRTPKELAGTLFREFTHPDDYDVDVDELRRVLAGETDRYQLEKRFRHADGHYVWVSISASPVRDDSGVPHYLIGQVEDITERRALQESLAHAAVHDLLTGLPNRMFFMDRLEQALKRIPRHHGRVALMFLDLDRFKMVNDSLGHDAGDQTLQQVAERISTVLRLSDTLARFGGDEFTVLCEVVHQDEALDIAERIVEATSQPLSTGGNELYQSVSIGIALSDSDADSGAELLRNADVAMYRAKAQGPGRVVVYRPDEETTNVSRLQTSSELHRALERSELELHYQPLVELHATTLVGMEALVRWNHPTRGQLLPGEFVPLAEESGVIVALGRWVLDEACRQTAGWIDKRRQAGLEDFRCNITVNVSSQQLADLGFARHVEGALTESGLSPDQLWLEITESTLMGDVEQSIVMLNRLRDLGIHLAIDDFGTGYSSLSYLKQFPVETLKIDRSFVADIDRDLDDVAIARAIIALGDSLHMSVIAEGIERSTQAQQLMRLGCFLAQGYYYGCPAPAAQLEPFPADDLTSWVPLMATA
jgi:diguanylate cyclase (GGDEF)-like protein/PAS domain S-box-containing protein